MGKIRRSSQCLKTGSSVDDCLRSERGDRSLQAVRRALKRSCVAGLDSSANLVQQKRGFFQKNRRDFPEEQPVAAGSLKSGA